MNSCCRNDPIYDMLHFLNWYCSLKHQLVCPKNLQVSSHVSTQPSFLLRKKSWICMCHFLFRECHTLQHWYNCDWWISSKWTQFYANKVTLVPGMYYMYVRHFWAERSLIRNSCAQLFNSFPWYLKSFPQSITSCRPLNEIVPSMTH